MDYQKSDLVKLSNGKIVEVLNLPTAFMANGSYEVQEYIDNGIGSIGKPFWIKPEEILYPINKKAIDDINHYFEIIWDEDGLNLIPKDFSSIDIESDREDFNRIKFNFDDGRKHKMVNIHVGDSVINDMDKVTTRPKPKKENKFKEIINVLKDKKNE